MGRNLERILGFRVLVNSRRHRFAHHLAPRVPITTLVTRTLTLILLALLAWPVASWAASDQSLTFEAPS